MKRNQVVDIIAGWGAPEILEDVYGAFGNRTNLKEWADNLLYVLETECGFIIPESDTDLEAFKKEQELYAKK